MSINLHGCVICLFCLHHYLLVAIHGSLLRVLCNYYFAVFIERLASTMGDFLAVGHFEAMLASRSCYLM